MVCSIAKYRPLYIGATEARNNRYYGFEVWLACTVGMNFLMMVNKGDKLSLFHLLSPYVGFIRYWYYYRCYQSDSTK